MAARSGNREGPRSRPTNGIMAFKDATLFPRRSPANNTKSNLFIYLKGNCIDDKYMNIFRILRAVFCSTLHTLVLVGVLTVHTVPLV